MCLVGKIIRDFGKIMSLIIFGEKGSIWSFARKVLHLQPHTPLPYPIMIATTIYRIVLTLLLTLLAVPLSAQSYAKLWRQAQRARTADLPREALAKIVAIEAKAAAQGDTHQHLLALFAGMHLRETISPDSLDLDRERIGRHIQQLSNPSDRALWKTLLAKTVASSAQISYEERRNSSREMLKQLEDMERLHGIKADYITPLVQQGKDADEFDNDVLHLFLFDCLNQSFLSQQERTALSSQAEAFYRSKGLYAGAIRFALRYEDAEAVIARYADRHECAIAYASWVENLYARGDLSDNHVRQEIITLAHEGIEKYGKHRDAKRLEAVVRGLENPTVSVSEHEALCYPNRPMKLAVQANHVQKASFEVYRCSADGNTLFNRIATLQTRFPEREAWRLQTDTLSLTLSEPGVYKLIQKGTGKEAVSTLLTCSRITPFLFYPSNGACRIMALDTQTGEAFKEFSVVKYETEDRPQRQWDVTEGELWLSMKDMGETSSYQSKFQILMPGDSCSEKFRLYLSKKHYNTNEQRYQQRVQIFTDRNIYRPGQTVHVVGILYTQKGDSLCVDTNASLQVELIKRGDKAVASFEAKTDDFGQFQGKFLLPDDQQEGNFYFQVRHADKQGKEAEIYTEGNANFVVGAYKRPTFSVEFLPINMAYTWGDTLQVRGKALTMTLQPIANTLVRYAISTNTSFRGTSDAPIEGVLRTDAQGEFSIPLLLKKLPKRSALWRHYYSSYNVSVSVVGDNGETQTGQIYIPLHQRPTTLDVEVPEVIVKEQLPHLVFRNTNNMSVKVDERVTVSLYDRRNALVWIQKCPANTSVLLSDWSKLDDGVYRLEAQTPSGEKVSRECLFISEKSRKLPAQSPSFFITEGMEKSESEKWLFLGHSRQKVTLFKDVVSHKGELLSSEIVTLSEGVHSICLSYDTVYGEGATIHLTALTEGEFYQREIRLKHPQPDLRLNMSWKTFRNRLQPGQKEEWKLRISHPDGKPVSTALTARLYDASLNALATNNWRVNPYRKPYFQNSYTQVYKRMPTSIYYAKKYKVKESRPVDFSSWNEWLNGQEHRIFFATSPAVRLGSTAKRDASNIIAEVDVSAKTSTPTDGTIHGASPSHLPLRENFNEVAFMLSSLHTDADGIATLRFTLPEQLTAWKFTAFAHNKDLHHALMEEDITVQKAVSVTANVPRFIREGDSLVIPVVVRSTVEKSLEGRFTATFFDIESGVTHSQTTGSFVTNLGSAAFSINAPSVSAAPQQGVPLPQAIGFQIEVETKDCSDGEAHKIPVLPNQVEVVRSLPFSLSRGDRLTYDLDTLWTDTTLLRAPKVAVNFTPSALHEALQALSNLSIEPTYSIDDWARRYYAQTLTIYLHKRGVYLPDFNLNRAEMLRDEAANYIRRQQMKNGSWAWFEGMHESPFITCELLLLFARLQCLTGNHPLTESATLALKYMHAQMEARRIELEREQQRHSSSEGGIEHLPLRYLDACHYLRADTTEAFRYFLSKAEGVNSDYSLHSKAVMSRVMLQSGNCKAAEALLKSLREYLVETPEMGAYFDAPKACLTPHSYRIPTHVAVLEAFHAVGDTLTVGKMQQWLLQSKRTQKWEDSRTAADAVYALCLGTTPDKQRFAPHKPTPLDTIIHGRFNALTVEASATLGNPQLTAQGASLTLNVPNPTSSSLASNFAYGSVRAHYALPLSSVRSFNSGLGIALRYEVRVGGEWQEVSPEALIQPTLPLRQVVEITASRDFDFVRLSVPRPACVEPTERFNGYTWQDRVGEYRVVTDTGADFYVDKLPKGSYRFVEMLHTDRTGTYQQGSATISCTFAPEFSGNTASGTLRVGSGVGEKP